MEDTIAPEPRAAWVAGGAEQGLDSFVVTHPFDGNEVATVAVPGGGQVEHAVAAAAGVAGELARTSARLRAGVLEQASRGLASRAEEIAEVITAESAKPLHWARVEVDRAVTVFRIAAERVRESAGQPRRLDSDPDGAGRLALVRRVPRGPVLAITSSDSPLNQVAHNVAPALAVGAPIVVKPASRTPLTALIVGEVLAEADLPVGSFSVLPVGDEMTCELVRDPRLPVVSFTGSGPLGWSIVDSVPRKHVRLELPGNVAVAVLADWADLDGAARRIATFGDSPAGRSSIAVRRVLVQREIAEEFIGRLTEAVRTQQAGDPYDPDISVGPVVDEDAARHIVSWIEDAVEAGAELLVGGTRSGTAVRPTLLRDVPHEHHTWTGEIFGPVLAVSVVDSVDDALAAVDGTEFGRQASIFTRDVRVIFRASAELDVAGLVIGDVPSGTGRENVTAAMTDLTEERVTVLTGVQL